MSSIDSIANPLLDPAISRALVPVQPAQQTTHRNQDSSPRRSATVISQDQRIGLQDRAVLLQQKGVMAESENARTRHAIGAYQALDNSEERERISGLLGVDEYA